jgi:hypothetical protein
MDRALVVGIDDYGTLDPVPLVGSANGLISWQKLLVKTYGFTVHTLASPLATKDAILLELNWLASATQNERAVFVFCGEGTQVNRPDPGGGTHLEQGLVMYPRPGDTLESATLFGDEIVAALRGSLAPFSLVFDACFSAGVIEGPLHPRPLYIDARRFGLARTLERKTLSFLRRLLQVSESGRSPSMVVAAASGAHEPAYEGDIDGLRQLFFSEAVTRILTQYPTHSYDSLYPLVTQLLAGIQTPVLQGDTSRYANQVTY